MDSIRRTLLQSLANTVADYRQNEISPIMPHDIEKWLNQFDSDDQLIILAEMDSIMKQFYFSRMRVKEAIRAFLKETIIRNDDPIQLLPHLAFLNIQKIGSSQGAILNVVDEILQEEYSWPISKTGTQEVYTYIYMDDGIYTGNKIRYDLTDGTNTIGWLSTDLSFECTLWIFTIAGHIEGIDYVRRFILNAAVSRQVKVYRKTVLEINNIRRQGSSFEVLWPENLRDTYIDSYMSEMEPSVQRGRFAALFRSVPPLQERLFSSPEARRVVEQAFLKKGIQLVKASKNPAPSMRPLGFMKLASLGFGTFFVTYRNIANNCPLVLWWGDPNLPSTHPIGQWYPLFPRRTNEQRDIIVAEQLFDNPF